MVVPVSVRSCNLFKCRESRLRENTVGLVVGRLEMPYNRSMGTRFDRGDFLERTESDLLGGIPAFSLAVCVT